MEEGEDMSNELMIIENEKKISTRLKEMLDIKECYIDSVSIDMNLKEKIFNLNPDLVLLDSEDQKTVLENSELLQEVLENLDISIIIIDYDLPQFFRIKLYHFGVAEIIHSSFTMEELTHRIKFHLEYQNKKKKLSKTLQQYKTIFNSNHDAMFLLNVESDNRFTYELLNDTHEHLTGLHTNQVKGKTPDELFDRELARRLNENYKKCLDKRHMISYKEELELPNGKRFWKTTLSPVILNGEIVQIVGSSKDITNSMLIEEKINYYSYHDQLTDLYNRHYYEQELKNMDDDKMYPLSIIIGDVNGLKLTNDIFGHQAGDQLLIKIARIMEECTREEDVVARWGGDEYSIILPNTSNADAKKIVERIQQMTGEQESKTLPLDIALGVATKEDERMYIEDIYKAAEDEMYQVKTKQKNSPNNPLLKKIVDKANNSQLEVLKHTSDLQKKAKALAKSLSLDEEDTDKLLLLCGLHDVGKFAVSESILDHSDHLSDAQWEEYLTHIPKGAEIVNNFNAIKHLRDNILYHHEFWNGKGYISGLEGEEIPYLTRVLQVVDLYDAITSHMFYPLKKDVYFTSQLTKEEATEVLKEYAGEILDPEITRVFLKEVLKCN